MGSPVKATPSVEGPAGNGREDDREILIACTMIPFGRREAPVRLGASSQGPHGSNMESLSIGDFDLVSRLY